MGKVISLGEQVQSGIKILGHLIFRQELLLLQQSYPYRSSLGSVIPLALVVLRCDEICVFTLTLKLKDHMEMLIFIFVEMEDLLYMTYL